MLAQRKSSLTTSKCNKNSHHDDIGSNMQDDNNEPPEENPHPEYEVYRLYMEYLENQQKIVFDFWRQFMKNVWWNSDKDKE